MRTETGQVFKLEAYRPSDYLIPTIHMAFRLDPVKTSVVARLDVVRAEDTAAGTALILNGDELSLVDLKIDGKSAAPDAYEAQPDQLLIKRPPASDRFSLEIETELLPKDNTALMGLYRSNSVYCTQCEAEGFRRITYFLDRPDILSVYTVRIEAKKDEAPILLSNGNPGEGGDLADGWHYREWHDPHPKPSYLFALVAGDLAKVPDRFNTASGRDVDLAIYVEHGKQQRAAYAMDALKRSMAWDEEVFGLEYDLDVFNIVAVSDFNMGAMENKGLNIFNDKYVLADEKTATDTDFANIEAIIAHEYFHNWTGNRITCRDWFQLCLKEGLTVFRDHEFSADQRSRTVKRIQEVRALKAHQFPEDAGPLAHPVRPRRYREINNFYTATVYEKGSEVVRMIRTILGPELFRKGMDLYFERHDGEAATIEQFLAAFQDAADRDLSQFALWYHQAGTPNLTIKSSYRTSEETLTLEIEQSLAPTPGEARKKLMHIPLAFGLVGDDGTDLTFGKATGAVVEDGVVHVSRRHHTVRFAGVSQRPTVSLLRGFSAPVTLNYAQSPRDRMFLARHDSDLFSRWQSLDRLLSDTLVEFARLSKDGKSPKTTDALNRLCGDIAGDAALEPAYRALVLTLPGEADIAREMATNVDPDAIHRAREGLIGMIAGANHERFTGVYDALSDDRPFATDAKSAGERALRNILLDYLCAAANDASLAHSQYETASNMSDLSAALDVLVRRFPDSGETNEALSVFERRFEHDPLVLDKWFAIQAMAPGAQTLDRVEALVEHKAFSLENPNRIRALVGSYVNGNPTGFHRADGAGYRFLAGIVLDVDKRNPQVASRLATALRSWRSLEAGRRDHARKALLSIAADDKLTMDVRDIVERTLADI